MAYADYTRMRNIFDPQDDYADSYDAQIGSTFDPQNISGGGFGISPGIWDQTQASNPRQFDNGALQGPPKPLQNPPATQEPVDDPMRFNKQWADMMNQYTPETTATNAYNDLIAHMPTYHPGLGRALVSAGLTLGKGGFKDAMDFMDRPYTRDVSAWKDKAGQEYNAANLERQANQNERLLMSQMATAAINSQKADETERYNRDRIRSADENNRARNAINWYRAQTPDWEWDFSGPTIRRMNKKGTGEVIDTGIETGKLDQETLTAMQNEGRIAAARATSQGAMDRTIAAGNQFIYDAQGNIIGIANPRAGAGNQQGTGQNGLPSGFPEGARTENNPRGGGSLSPTEVKQDRINRANAAKMQNPDIASYITIENGEVKINYPKAGPFSGVSGALVKKLDDARDYIFADAMNPKIPKGGQFQSPPAGDTIISGPGRSGGPGPNGAVQQPQTLQEQRAAVQAGTHVFATNPKTGQRGIIPKSMIQQAIKDGLIVDGYNSGGR